MTVDSFVSALFKFFPVSGIAFFAANFTMAVATLNGHHYQFWEALVPNMVYIVFWTPMIVLITAHELEWV